MSDPHGPRVSQVVMRAAALRLEPAVVERMTGGTWNGKRVATTVRGASLDSRRITHGCLFACLVGASHDGHDHAASAVGDGAALILANRPLTVPAPVLVVKDVPAALAILAGELRRRLTACTWIAVAGANGKTTTKELIAAACRAETDLVHATQGNLNNHLGVPLTVLNTPGDARYAVIEVGTNHPGEVAALCRIVQPQVTAIASIGPEHLEGLIDLVGVAREEGAALAALPPGGTGIVGVHRLAALCRESACDLQAVLGELRAAAQGRTLVLVDDEGLPGAEPAPGEVGAERLTLSVPGGGNVDIHLLGAHNLVNAHVALRTALAAGVPAAKALLGLGRVRAVAGRLVAKRIGPHRLLDDSYNANPGSMAAGLAALARCPGARLAVLGAMGELGAASAAGHAQVGREAARLGIPLITVSPAASGIAEACRAGGGEAATARDKTDAARQAIAWLKEHGPATVLVKASRSAGLEAVVADLAAAFATGPGARP